jgi:nucleoside-diphosphate-sugar epimerase
MDEVEAGNLQALIARSADFYGPAINNSLLLEVVFKNLQKGKKANWFCADDKPHSFTYTPDAAKATAILGNDEKAYNQVWHLPTAPNPLTGKEWIETFANEMNVKSKHMVVGKTMVQLLGLFNSIMKEFVEMLYQYDREYVFDSSKFDKAYSFKPTSYLDGVKEVIKAG